MGDTYEFTRSGTCLPALVIVAVVRSLHSSGLFRAAQRGGVGGVGGGLPDNSVITIEVSSWRGLHPRNCAHTSSLRLARTRERERKRRTGEGRETSEGLPLNRG